MIALPAWLVRSLFFPLHERLRGRRTIAELRALRRLVAAGPEAVAADKRERLRALLIFAAAHLRYYRDVFAATDIRPHAADSIAELGRLPVLLKTDIRANQDRLVWRGAPGGLRPHSSGGTSGDTLHFFIDRVRQAQNLAGRLFMQALFGAPVGVRRIHVWGSPIESRGTRLRTFRDALLNERLRNAFDLSPAGVDAHLEYLRRARPVVLYGYPSAIAWLARRALERRAAGGFDALRMVVLTGEEIEPAQRAIVRAAFGCAVAAEYGSREVGLIGHDCPHGRMHLLPHNFVEFLRDGRRLAPGLYGDIVCTTLDTRAQPFIRYRLGDIGAAVAGACECGLPLPQMRITAGKITGFIALADGRLCHGAITSHVLRDIPGVIEFKTYQHAVNQFEVLLVVDPARGAVVRDQVAARYRALFGPRVTVDCRIVSHIPPDRSGKRRYVVSAVAPASAAAPFADAPGEDAG